MNTSSRTDLQSKTFAITKSYTRLIDNELSFDSFKFYQKLLVLLISFSTILIFPESPRDLANICESYHSRKICKVW